MTFLLYLVIINVIAFLLYTADYFIYRKTRGEFKPQVLLNISTTFGGALGTLVALALWDRKTCKGNLMSRVYTLSWLIVQIIFVYIFYGPNRNQTIMLFHSFIDNHPILCTYIVVINIVTFIIFVADKIKSIRGKWRIKEKTLLGFSLIGGAFGGFIAMDFCNHKVNTPYFMYGLQVMIIIHLLLIICVAIGII